jgi:hypothetical protein
VRFVTTPIGRGPLKTQCTKVMWFDLALADVSAEDEAAMQSFPVR